MQILYSSHVVELRIAVETMAHDRSARFVKLTTRTPEVVGPGSYDICEPLKPPRDLRREYPFLSGTARKTLELGKDVGSLPGPGSYNHVEPRRHVTERWCQYRFYGNKTAAKESRRARSGGLQFARRYFQDRRAKIAPASRNLAWSRRKSVSGQAAAFDNRRYGSLGSFETRRERL